MRLEDERESENVEDRRGEGFGGGVRPGHIGIGTIVVALVASYFLGVSPSTILSMLSGNDSQVSQVMPARKPPADGKMAKFVAKVLAETEDTWKTIFREAGGYFRGPELMLFYRAPPTTCGTGKTAQGPFYCPLDE